MFHDKAPDKDGGTFLIAETIGMAGIPAIPRPN
jgi:hypothetical protein